jgi:internalin A
MRDALGKPPGEEITAAEMTALTKLVANKKNIADLAGIEHCVNLAMLELRYNEISDLSHLANLTNLTSLGLFENQISDICYP